MNTRFDIGRIATALILGTGFSTAAIAGIDIPDKPLLSGNSVPANLMLILDDSNSMAFDYLMDSDVSMVSTKGASSFYVGRGAYTSNRLAYDPRINYRPWLKADGTEFGVPSYSAVPSDGYTVTGGTIDLFSTVQTFYVPMSDTSDIEDAGQYYRYQILNNGRVVRSERSEPIATPVLELPDLAAARNSWVNGTSVATAPTMLTPSVSAAINVPAGASSLVVGIEGSDLNANVYVRYGSPPDTSNYNCIRNNANTSTETCVINSPAAGTWYVGVRAGNADNTSNFAGVKLTVSIATADPAEIAGGCETGASWGWRKCTYVTPTGRSEADERANYAIWYAYHRTRSKAAKDGIFRAFSGLGTNYRVGLAGLYEITKKIPVSQDAGAFRGINRSSWFQAVLDKGASSGGATPLRGALQRTGEYFSDSSSTGPYAGTGVNQLSCRQNFAILTSDGYWNADAGSDFTGLSDDSVAGSTIAAEDGRTYTYSPVAPYSSTYTATLADVAMSYWKKDLRPDLANNVPTTSKNPAFWQHMVTFGISLGLDGSLDYPGDLACLTAGTCNWPKPVDAGPGEGTQPANIDDLWHAAVNGRGQFFSARSANEFSEALKSALTAVVERTASSSNVIANQNSLSTDSRIFQARYVSNQWSGELSSYRVDGSGIDSDPEWNASQGIPAYEDRKILTSDASGGTTFPSASQLAILDAKISGTADYIRGDRKLEESRGNGGEFRDRPHVLGDIVHSSPYYVADSQALFVGANDGMMHAFRATDGVELFAYVPASLDFARLAKFPTKNYGHAYFVDGPLVVTTTAETPGKNILIGTLGRGGKGLYALDVTAPEAMTEQMVLWDHGAAEYPLMGHSIGRPVVAKLNTGEYGLLVSNGPNSAKDTAVLYVLDIRNGAIVAEIDTGVGGGATGANGLSEPRGWDRDGDGDVDDVYAGDLLGNLWKFDISSNAPSSWNTAANRKLLLSAKDSAGTPQPISGRPSVAMDPETYETWVFFGTGRLLNDDDLYKADGSRNLSVQSWYGLLDGGATTATRDDLQQRSIIASATVSGRPARAFEAHEALASGKRGWFIDLVMPAPIGAEGERIVSDSTVIGNVLIAASVIPEGDDCDQGGRGYINAIDAFSGTTLTSSFFDIDGDGQFDDETVSTDDSAVVAGSVDVGVSMPTAPTVIDEILVAGGSSGAAGAVKVAKSGNQGRISWTEIIEK